MILDFIGQVFWWGILGTPVLVFLALRKMDMNGIAKLLLGLIITIILSVTFYFISIGIIFRDGMGPG
jgi:hypothetical protein